MGFDGSLRSGRGWSTPQRRERADLVPLVLTKRGMRSHVVEWYHPGGHCAVRSGLVVGVSSCNSTDMHESHKASELPSTSS